MKSNKKQNKITVSSYSNIISKVANSLRTIVHKSHKSTVLASMKKFMKIAEDFDIIYNDEDRGLYSDVSEGRDGIRKSLIELLVNAFEGTENQPYAEEVVEALKEPHGNDWFDEKAAIKMLNSVTDDDLNWDIVDGELLLLGEDDYEYVDDDSAE